MTISTGFAQFRLR